MDERRMTNEQRERERRRKVAAARKAAARYEDPLSETEKSKKKTSPCQKRVYCIAGDLYSCHWACRWNNILDKVWADKRNL